MRTNDTGLLAPIDPSALSFPLAIDDAFREDFFYTDEGMMIDAILDIDPAKHFVRVRMPTHDELPITRAQRVHPTRHPRHVSGGLMVHMTGVVGFVHSYYVLGMRHRAGWVGYGGKLYSAKFKAMAPPGEPLILEGTATQMRKLGDSMFVRYAFQFFQNQGGKRVEVYEGDQSAMWLRARESEAAR
jgi:hypothetical protein